MYGMVKTIYVYRPLWLRGLGHYNSFLLRRLDNMMCCIGQLCLQEGYLPVEIMGHRNVEYIPDRGEKNLRIEALGLSKFHGTESTYRINDDEKLNDSKRELMLKENFAHFGYNLIFTDDEKHNPLNLK